MKRSFSILVTAICATTLLVGSARAGSVDYLSNQSADYMRTFARNAATDSADVAFYNPAGAAFLRDGLYLNLNTQHVLKYYSIQYEGTSYESNKPTPILPTLFAVWKWRHLAAFATFTVPGGGGSLNYEKGVPYLIPLAVLVPDRDGALVEGKFEGSSMYLAPSIGASYELFDIVSASAAFRMIYATRSVKGYGIYGTKRASLDAKKKALGFGGVFGVHVRPIKQLDIGIRYETETSLNFKTTSTIENCNTPDGTALEFFEDGSQEKRNLPATLGLGIAAHVLPRLTLSVNLTYYFIKAANTPDAYDGQQVVGYDDDYRDGIELSAAIEFRLLKNLIISAGYNRSWSGGNKDTFGDFDYTLSSNAIGTGARFTLFDKLDLTGAFAAVLYEEGKNDSLYPALGLPGETFRKQSFVFSLGIQYRFF
jgi:long-chain fatty acid transport protein